MSRDTSDALAIYARALDVIEAAIKAVESGMFLDMPKSNTFVPEMDGNSRRSLQKALDAWAKATLGDEK